jgi:hypothetical protein
MSNRRETQMINSEHLHPNISFNASQASGRKRKKQRQGVQRAGSRGGLVNQEETPFGDQDSGIVDGCTSASDDRNLRQRNRDKQVICRRLFEWTIFRDIVLYIIEMINIVCNNNSNSNSNSVQFFAQYC